MAQTTTSNTNHVELTKEVKIGIIGGSGLYALDNLKVLGEVYPQTPWGYPSDRIVICATASGGKVAFLPRHGKGHVFLPTEVPSRANIAALKSIGVEVIVAFSAVGSLREEIVPGHFVLPDQLLDRTKGNRPSTFFEHGLVGHVPFADPFHPRLATLIARVASEQLQASIHQATTTSSTTTTTTTATVGTKQPTTGEAAAANSTTHFVVHQGKTLVCMEGPAFSTRAESHLYRSWGGDVINMSAVPESKLAREAEMAYQMVCMATDYDCWRVELHPVDVATVMATMEHNKHNAKRLVSALLPELERALATPATIGAKGTDDDFLVGVRGATQFGVMTDPSKVPAAALERIRYLHPKFRASA